MRTETDWEAVHQRQTDRAQEVLGWCWRLLALDRGDTVLDLGCGPGYPAAWIAERIEPGAVIAVDRDSGALTYLRCQHPTPSIVTMLGDIRYLPLRFDGPIPTLLTFVLHHIDRPVDAIESIGTALPAGSPVIIAEYRPSAAGDVGPPLDRRISSAAIRRWLRRAGFTVEHERPLPNEKVVILARRCSS